jgi:hypothetical protein
MELTVGVLRKVIKDLPNDIILGTLKVGNGEFDPFLSLKRLMLLQDQIDGHQYLTINEMGSHFTGEGYQKNLKYADKYWNEDNLKEIK